MRRMRVSIKPERASFSAKADTKQVVMRQADAQGKNCPRYSKRERRSKQRSSIWSTRPCLRRLTGVVTHKQVEIGQIVQQGQGLMVIVPLQDVWVTDEF